MGALGISAGQAAINTGSGILGSIFGLATAGINDRRQLRQQDKLNEQAYDINNKMAEENYKREMRKWEETNYSAQKAQLEKAGLNPALLYGMSGGGGSTAQTQGGQGVSAGQAPHGGGEMQAMGMMMQQNMMNQAQIDLLKAQTENVKTNTIKTGGVDTRLAEVQIQSMTQGIENLKATEKLTIVDTELKDIAKKIATDTQADQTHIIEQASRQADEILTKMQQDNEISYYEMLNAEQTANENLINLKLANDNARKNLQLQDAKMKEISNSIAQKWKQIQINARGQDTNAGRLELDKWLHNMQDSWKVAAETIGDVLKVVVGRGTINTGKGRTETHEYSEPGYKHTITDKH